MHVYRRKPRPLARPRNTNPIPDPESRPMGRANQQLAGRIEKVIGKSFQRRAFVRAAVHIGEDLALATR